MTTPEGEDQPSPGRPRRLTLPQLFTLAVAVVAGAAGIALVAVGDPSKSAPVASATTATTNAASTTATTAHSTTSARDTTATTMAPRPADAVALPSALTCAGPNPCTTASALGPISVYPVTTDATTFYSQPATLSAEPGGTLVAVQPLADGLGVPSDAYAFRFLFHSPLENGADALQSGLLFIPVTKSPRRGFPLVVYGHPTTGDAISCAPSMTDSPGIPNLSALIGAGDAVVAPDYEGEGIAGQPSYLIGDSEGRSILDSAKAALQLPGITIANKVVAYGYSEGGHAALFAAQMAPSYAPSLHLVGVVAISPVTYLEGLVFHIGSNSFLNSFLVMMASSWSVVYPQLPLSDVLSPTALTHQSVDFATCVDGITAAYGQLSPEQLTVAHYDANPVWAHLMAINDPGAQAMKVPALIVHGGNDVIIPASLVDHFVGVACGADHDQLQTWLYPSADHASITKQSARRVVAFIRQRFAGRAQPTGCINRRAS